ncbi:Peptidoglycan/LPS O-acetylase OafA/YrhL, contains acyltransferase and SGNH-hydrolase domains [Pseudomonas sp. NFACC23-1]|uniref:acyltransferase family protein n=1 Tax=unclassified Pseudomonas TaxID=196821 RepID=UPI000887C4BA|nr:MULTISPECIES: acyltransferase family protein [unclassified Pseudomonas]SDB07082.1 Peptidoglycan/LPS O-acetylase OafA/YrhL, contains acyltransferase and SGNH-hydrolase domains [Pseudomonas sp. NFACC17-2]SEI96532.1 Peptidoglycan/LPS O-acetylase OafA/YrhL, contains acyltransferase and SGNH-hydrolase domains [Pseudomonas sp. NFACC23-1]SFW33447.1 Peptidoglycan/LPS O-acetylase OafA/YrhL, contains acyltransferase and SGNH-hydrolase domains [Pseudomonas sp. NFACC16-2]
MQSKHTVYRPDIDGLRAIAVLSVVAFHAFPSFLKGGFIGVDVFFVISGYLISKILFTGLDNGSFSVFDFYSRRINRIYPALILVLLSCLAFGWIALLADEYAQLGKHAAGGAGFVANIVLWSESGYFDNISETKPLLHLWSLGVEEQFYIIWPVLLFTLWKSNLNRLSAILAMAAASFYINISIRQSDPSTTFYSPQTRFWELLVGSIIAYLSVYRVAILSEIYSLVGVATSRIIYQKIDKHSDNTIKNIQSLVGLSMLTAGFLIITKERLFPGYWAILPVMGTALIIGAGSKSVINKYILSNRIMVWVGLISFPLYLWHWPILSFARIIEAEEPPVEIRIAAVAISIVLAWATYKFVERPIRFFSTSGKRTTILFATMLAVGTFGFYVFKHEGVQSRQIVANLKQKSADLQRYSLTKCKSTDPTMAEMSWCNQTKEGAPIDYILWGDSHAEHIIPGLKKETPKNWLVIGRHSCPPLRGVKVWLANMPKDACEKANYKSLEIIKESNVRVVALAALGPLYFSDHGFSPEHARINDKNPDYRLVLGEQNEVSKKLEIYKAGLDAAISEITKQGKKVVLIKDVPEFRAHPKACLSRPFKTNVVNCDVDRQEYDERTKVYDQVLADAKAKNPNVYVFDSTKPFCDSVKCASADKDHIFYRDGHHLSEAGSGIVARNLAAFIESSVK